MAREPIQPGATPSPAGPYCPESIVIAVDIDAEVAQEAQGGATRLDVIKQCIQLFAVSKFKVNSAHKIGLAVLERKACWATSGLTGSTDSLLRALRDMRPSPVPFESFDMGSLVELVQPLVPAEEADGARVRVIMLYCRSNVAPVWASHRDQGIRLDVVYLHEKPLPGLNSPQEVYSALEETVDCMCRPVGHSAYVFEANYSNVRKLTSLMVWLMAHPSQRGPQHDMRVNPTDLSLAAHLPLPSAAGALPTTFNPSPQLAASAATSLPGPGAPTGAPATGVQQGTGSALGSGGGSGAGDGSAERLLRQYRDAAGGGAGAGAWGSGAPIFNPLHGLAGSGGDEWAAAPHAVQQQQQAPVMGNALGGGHQAGSPAAAPGGPYYPPAFVPQSTGQPQAPGRAYAAGPMQPPAPPPPDLL